MERRPAWHYRVAARSTTTHSFQHNIAARGPCWKGKTIWWNRTSTRRRACPLQFYTPAAVSAGSLTTASVCLTCIFRKQGSMCNASCDCMQCALSEKVAEGASFEAHERYMDEQLKELQRRISTARSRLDFGSCAPYPNGNGALQD